MEQRNGYKGGNLQGDRSKDLHLHNLLGNKKRNYCKDKQSQLRRLEANKSPDLHRRRHRNENLHSLRQTRNQKYIGSRSQLFKGNHNKRAYLHGGGRKNRNLHKMR